MYCHFPTSALLLPLTYLCFSSHLPTSAMASHIPFLPTSLDLQTVCHRIRSKGCILPFPCPSQTNTLTTWTREGCPYHTSCLGLEVSSTLVNVYVHIYVCVRMCLCVSVCVCACVRACACLEIVLFCLM